jgi:hypothetical protein
MNDDMDMKTEDRISDAESTREYTLRQIAALRNIGRPLRDDEWRLLLDLLTKLHVARH